MRGKEQKKPETGITTISGKVTREPQRIKTKTGKAIAVLTLQAESDPHSPYPVQVVAFDADVLALMRRQHGQRITVTGLVQWRDGYQLVVKASD